MSPPGPPMPRRSPAASQAPAASHGLASQGAQRTQIHPQLPSVPFFFRGCSRPWQGFGRAPHPPPSPLSSLLIFPQPPFPPRCRRKATPSLSPSDRWSGPAAPSPPLRPCFSEVSLHFPPETPRPSISLLRGKREISNSRIESPQLPSPLARRPASISAPGRRAWEEAAHAWATKKTKRGSLCPPSGPVYLGLVAGRIERGVRRRRGGWMDKQEPGSLYRAFSNRVP